MVYISYIILFVYIYILKSCILYTNNNNDNSNDNSNNDNNNTDNNNDNNNNEDIYISPTNSLLMFF